MKKKHEVQKSTELNFLTVWKSARISDAKIVIYLQSQIHYIVFKEGKKHHNCKTNHHS